MYSPFARIHPFDEKGLIYFKLKQNLLVLFDGIQRIIQEVFRRKQPKKWETGIIDCKCVSRSGRPSYERNVKWTKMGGLLFWDMPSRVGNRWDSTTTNFQRAKFEGLVVLPSKHILGILDAWFNVECMPHAFKRWGQTLWCACDACLLNCCLICHSKIILGIIMENKGLKYMQ